ncbi:unnamed protein product [Closterium sp. NIES-54]
MSSLPPLFADSSPPALFCSHFLTGCGQPCHLPRANGAHIGSDGRPREVHLHLPRRDEGCSELHPGIGASEHCGSSSAVQRAHRPGR